MLLLLLLLLYIPYQQLVFSSQYFFVSFTSLLHSAIRVHSIRRGYQVYREVCSACHGINEIAFRNLDVAFTEKEIKVLAAEVDVVDGPDDKGEMFTRPGRASDYMKGPYKNEQEARAMNGGAYPPDLSVMTKARPYGDDYLFSLLIGYEEPPVGMSLREGLYFNGVYPEIVVMMMMMMCHFFPPHILTRGLLDC